MTNDTTQFRHDEGISAQTDSPSDGADLELGIGVIQLAQTTAASTDAPLELPIPQGQQIVVVPVSPGQTLVLPTDRTDGVLGKFGPEGNLAFVVAGRTIIFQGFIRANDESPVRIVTSDGDPVDAAEIVAATDPDLDIQ